MVGNPAAGFGTLCSEAARLLPPSCASVSSDALQTDGNAKKKGDLNLESP